MGKTLQYELWQECNNFCTYCTLGDYTITTPVSMKLDALNKAIDEIKTLKQGEVSSLGFIGGEFFQGQLNNKEVHETFFKLMRLVNELLNKEVISELWLNATLTIGKQEDLYNVIELIDQKSKLWILTSYDSRGRFRSSQKLKNWEKHLATIHTKYPEVHVNTTSIITGDFIDNYLNGSFNIELFKNTYKTSLFLKTPVKPDDKCNLSNVELNKLFGYEFFPTRDKFKKFLLTFKSKEGDEAFEALFSNELKAEELHKNFNDNQLRNVTFTRTKDFIEALDCDKDLKEIGVLPCGHPSIYNCYSDQDGCAVCDKFLIQSI